MHPFAFQQKFFLKSDDANQPNQPTSRKPIKMDNFHKNCRIWLNFCMQVSYPPCPPLPPLPTHSVADPNTFQIFFFVLFFFFILMPYPLLGPLYPFFPSSLHSLSIFPLLPWSMNVVLGIWAMITFRFPPSTFRGKGQGFRLDQDKDDECEYMRR